MINAFMAVDWHVLLMPHPSWFEKLIRPILVYLALLLIFRLSSKRALAQATLFDFLIVLMISNVVQNAMIGEDNSILGAVAGAIMLILLSDIFNRITAKSRRARRVLEGQPMLLIHRGVMDEETLERQGVAQNDLFSAIRKQGLARLADVEYAILELDGTISILKADGDERPKDCLPSNIGGLESKDRC